MSCRYINAFEFMNKHEDGVDTQFSDNIFYRQGNCGEPTKALGNYTSCVYWNVMLRLYILRHAKSAWPVPASRDHERPLNERGISDLPRIRTMLSERNYLPDIALCSSAQRTLDTWKGVQPAMPECVLKVHDELYESTTRQYLATIKAVEGMPSVMIVGHNPVCDDLTRLLITGDGPAAASFLPTHFPTGGLAVLDLEAKSWHDIMPTTANLVDFVRPKHLH